MRQHLRFKSFWLSSLVVLSGCATTRPGIKVDPCIVDGPEAELDCTTGTKPISAADNYTCFSPSDIEALLNYCRSTP